MTRQVWRPVTGGFVVASILLVLASIYSAPTASAHAILESSSPSDQSVLEGSPARVRLSFSEPVTLVTGALRVFDAAGTRVDEGLPSHAGSSSQVAVRLKPDLHAGSYVVSWRVISADSHPVHGGFVFSVRTSESVAGIDSLLDQSSQPGYEVARSVLGGIGYLGSFLVVGAAIFAAFVQRGDHSDRRLVGMLAGVTAVTVVAEVLGLAVAAALATGEGAASLFSPGVLGEMLGQGTAATIAGVALAAVAGLVAIQRTGRLRRVGALVSLALLVGAFVASGHTRTTDPAWLMSILDAVHVAAGAIWVGGVAALLWRLRARRRADRRGDQSGDPAVAADEVARFSRLATAAIIGVGAAGVVMAYVEIRSLRGLTSTGYGRLVLAKVALLVVLAGLGAFNHFRLVPALRSRPDRPARWRYLHRTLSWEALALVAVLGVTSVLVAAIPARTQLAAQAVYSQSVPLGTGASAGSANLVIDPARTGPTALHLYLLDEHGRPEDVAKSVVVELTQSELNIGPIDKQLRRAGPGHYLTNGTLFTVAGEWTVTMRVRVDEFSENSAVLKVKIQN
ncbi:MAG TPA: copper resistance protein CopC [Acidimicrobiales bacterium]|nr:copper resistance protein CopC [Acidimicrobiales bacterium]